MGWDILHQDPETLMLDKESVVLRMTSGRLRKPEWILFLHLWGYCTLGPEGGTLLGKLTRRTDVFS